MPLIDISDELAQSLLKAEGTSGELRIALRVATAPYPIPSGLSPLGVQAAKAVLAVAAERGSLCGGVERPFVHPDEWKARGETYGLFAELIVIHDGGPFAPLLSYDYEEYDWIERLTKRLSPLGVYAEQCTTWYSAIYLRGGS